MKQQLFFGGLANTPDNYSCADGLMAAAHGVVGSVGSMHPFNSPDTWITLGDHTMHIIHQIPGVSKSFIITSTYNTSTSKSTIYCFDRTDIGENDHPEIGDLDAVSNFQVSGQVKSVQQMGNVLTILTNKDLVYAIYRDGTYTFLDSSVPQIDMDFRLVGQIEHLTSNNVLALETEQIADQVVTNYTLANIGGKQTRSYLTDGRIYIPANVHVNIQIQADTTSKLHHALTIQFLKQDGTAYRTHTYDRKANNVWTADFDNKQACYGFKISYALNGSTWMSGAQFNATMTISYENTASKTYKLVNSQENFNAMNATVNKFLYTKGFQDNKFVFPFFVRYALRLFDGSMIYPSAPMLMIPNTGRAPFVCLSQLNDRDKKANIQVAAACTSLEYKFLNATAISQIKQKWGDLVTGVCIGVSEPLYTYDQGSKWDDAKSLMDYSVVSLEESEPCDFGIYLDSGSSDTTVRRHAMMEMYKEYVDSEITDTVSGITKTTMYDLPQMSSSDQSDSFKNTSGVFYTIKEIDIKDIPTTLQGFQELSMDDGTLVTLATHESMTENSTSLDKVVPADMSVYNMRTHLADLVITRFPGYELCDFMGHIDIANYFTTESANNDCTIEYKALITLSDGTTVKKAVNASPDNELSPIMWFYYPNSLARSVTFMRKATYYLTSGGSPIRKYEKCTVSLSQHTVLNGRYWWGNYCELPFSQDDTCTETEWNNFGSTETSSDGLTFHYPSQVMQSYAYNPFNLQSKVTTIGNGHILRLLPANLSLSADQSGRLPMVAFTDQGIWAVEIQSDGTLAPAQPVSSDICSVPGSITPLDHGIAFLTDRGVMVLAGQDVSCISPSFDVNLLCDVIPESMDYFDADNFADVAKSQDAFLVFDHAHQWILLCKPSGLTYVYSIPDSIWTCIEMSALYTLPTNTGSLLVIKGASNTVAVVDLSKMPSAASAGSIHFQTRPFALGDANERKVVRYVRIDGVLDKDLLEQGAQISLYGSNDLVNWNDIGASADDYRLDRYSGTGYKFFILQFDMDHTDENTFVSGATISYDPYSPTNDKLY